ncbi:MAG: DUF58 domain-containing protein, partial [Rhodothermales bacterium]
RIEIRTKGLVNNVFGGEYHSAFKGRGIEFSEVRPYQFGDDIRSIDWNVSARTGETYVKIFEEEREQTLMLVVDISGSEDFGSQNKFKREIAAEISAIIGFSAIKNNDKVGLLLFSDQVELFVPPKKGRRHVLRLIRDLFAHEAQSRRTNLSVALNHILHVLHRRSIVLIISDFFDTDFAKPLRLVAQRHDTVAIHMQDRREKELPPLGLVDLTDPETGETLIVDTHSRQARRAFARHAYKQRTNLADLFQRTRVDAVKIRTEENYVDPLIRFFRHRSKMF